MSKFVYIVLFVLITSFCNGNIYAQTATDSVKAVINKLFDSMKNSDGKSLMECFSDTAILQTISEKDGNVSVVTESLKEFADFVNAQPKGAADERITFDIVKVDGQLAIAWTPYQFYYNGQFSHCGVDSYQLVRINGMWKIQFIIDTRRKTDCD